MRVLSEVKLSQIHDGCTSRCYKRDKIYLKPTVKYSQVNKSNKTNLFEPFGFKNYKLVSICIVYYGFLVKNAQQLNERTGRCQMFCRCSIKKKLFSTAFAFQINAMIHK